MSYFSDKLISLQKNVPIIPIIITPELHNNDSFYFYIDGREFYLQKQCFGIYSNDNQSEQKYISNAFIIESSKIGGINKSVLNTYFESTINYFNKADIDSINKYIALLYCSDQIKDSLISKWLCNDYNLDNSFNYSANDSKKNKFGENYQDYYVNEKILYVDDCFLPYMKISVDTIDTISNVSFNFTFKFIKYLDKLYMFKSENKTFIPVDNIIDTYFSIFSSKKLDLTKYTFSEEDYNKIKGNQIVYY